MKKLSLTLCMAFLFMTGFRAESQTKLTASGLDPNNFKEVVNGKQTNLYVMKNKNGMEVCITNFGGRIVSIMAPDKDGKFRDVVLGFDKVSDYVNIPSDFGAAIGRYANRINKGRFKLDGKTIQLPVNNFGHCLHGGPKGWQYQVYTGKQLNDTTLEMIMHSPDGDMNFPGAVTAIVTYTLKSNNSIDITYKATTTKPTVINMTNHSYFNLTGDPDKLSLDNILYINADNYTPVDNTFMTTGEILPVKGTPLDFSKPKYINKDINDTTNIQIKNANGYDHNWVLNTKGDIRRLAAELYSQNSGIFVKVYTNEPGIQVYTGNFLDGTVKGKNGKIYKKHASVCLETQHYPDSPNKPTWPSTVLIPGKTYFSHCIFQFGILK